MPPAALRESWLHLINKWRRVAHIQIDTLGRKQVEGREWSHLHSRMSCQFRREPGPSPEAYVSQTRSILIPDDPQQRADCQRRLQSLLAKSTSLKFACLCTVDGRPWAFQRRDEGADAPRLSAVTSSMLALCETFAREAQRGRCMYNVMSADNGVVVTVRVPCRSARFALSVGADASETVAMALRFALDAASDLAGVLDAPARVGTEAATS